MRSRRAEIERRQWLFGEPWFHDPSHLSTSIGCGKLCVNMFICPWMLEMGRYPFSIVAYHSGAQFVMQVDDYCPSIEGFYACSLCGTSVFVWVAYKSVFHLPVPASAWFLPIAALISPFGKFIPTNWLPSADYVVAHSAVVADRFYGRLWLHFFSLRIF